MFTGSLTDLPSLRHLRGVIPRGYRETTWDDVPGSGGGRIVYIKIGASEKGQGHSSVNLELHELGHSVDRIIFGIRRDPDFLSLWKREREKLFPGNAYFCQYPEEYFAETFAMYHYSKETRLRIERMAPRTAKYIEKLQD